MTDTYDKYIRKENEIYISMEAVIPSDLHTGNTQLDYGLDWVCFDSHNLIDFGCGSGSMIFNCALRGVTELTGIDLSDEAIKLALKRAKQMACGKFQFMLGSVPYLQKVGSETIDAVILSNIIDNMFPEDTLKLLAEVQRIVKKEGRIFVKLNPYITQEQISQWSIKVVKDNLLDDGLLLWNLTTEDWRKTLTRYFKEEEFIDIYFPEYDQHNRMFLLKK